MKKSWVLIVVANLCAAGAEQTVFALPNPETLQFEGVAPDGAGSPFLTGYFTEGSYKVYAPYGQWVDSKTMGIGTEFPDDGTDWFLNNNTGGIVITRSSAAPFYLLSFNATEYDYVFAGGFPYIVDGILTDGSLISTTFASAQRMPYQTPQFQTFTMPSNWLGLPLKSVTITEPRDGFAVDNIRLAAVPEPTAICLAVLGLPFLAAIPTMCLCRRMKVS
jgi:hypothetical protein